MRGAGEGLGGAGQQRRAALRHGEPRGQEVHVDRDRLLHHRPVVVRGLARHVGVEVRPARNSDEYFRLVIF